MKRLLINFPKIKMNSLVKYLVISFILPFLLYYFIWFLVNSHPNSILNLPDVDSQYLPLYRYLKEVYSFDSSFFYSFYKGIGGSMWTTFFYYLSSPLNIIIIFFNKTNISEFLHFLCALKIGLCGLCMFIFLNSLNSKNLKINLLFSMCYALMGYNICYVKNVFWFDVVYMTPIVILGMNKLLQKGDMRLYIFSLIYCLLSNFYLTFSLGIFCLIYFWFFIKINKNVNKTFKIRFFIANLLCFGICCCFLIPTLFEIIQLKERISFGNLINIDAFNLPHLFYKVLIGSSSLNSHFLISFYDSPNLFCSLFVVLLNIIYFFNKSISIRERKSVIIIYFIFLLTMIFQPLNSIWHGFSITQGNSYRFSYLCSFLAILIAYRSYCKFKYFQKNDINFKVIPILITIFLCNIIMLLSRQFQFFSNGIEIAISFMFVIIYNLILKSKINFKILMLVILLELSVNMGICFKMEVNKSFSKYEEICYDYDTIKDMDKVRVNTLYYNTSFYCNLSTISSYLSTYNPYILDFFRKIGINSMVLAIDDDYSTTPIIDSLMGISYYIDDDYNIRNNDYKLSIGYMVYNNDNGAFYQNKIKYQEFILNSMINENFKYYNDYSFNNIERNIYSFFNDGTDKYLLLEDKLNYVFDVSYFNNNYHIILEGIDSLIITISNKNKEYVNMNITPVCVNKDKCSLPTIKLYELNVDNFEHAISILKEQQLNVTKMEKNRLEGNINVTKDNQYLFLSIPYEKGWNIYIDGKKTKYEKIYDAFIGIKLDKGYHEIKMVFYPYGLNIGIIISSISVAILIIYFAIIKKGKNLRK